MIGPVRKLLRWPRVAALALAVSLAAGAGGAFLWSQHHLHAAERALDRYAFDEAQHHLDLCLKVRFRSGSVHLLAAQAARRRGAYDEAERHLAACERLEGMTGSTSLEHLLLAAQEGDFGGSESLLRDRSAGDSPEAVLVLEALAKGYLSRFWTEDALRCLDRLLELRPRHPQALLLRARVNESLARKDGAEREQDALRDYQTALEVSPSFEARLGLAGTLYRLGRPSDALGQYEELRAAEGGRPEVLLGLARCRYRLNEVDEARRLLDELLESHPRHAAALLERGRLALHAGRAAEAEGWLRRADEAAPLCDVAACRLLCRCLDVERKEEARRCLDRLRQRETELLRVSQLTLRANRDPRDTALRYRIATELMRLGREADGVAALFVVLEQDPGHGPARAALADYFTRTGQIRAADRLRALAGRAGVTSTAR